MNYNKQMKAVRVSIGAILLVTGIAYNSQIARAGNINGNEASVISVARSTFEYEGKTYVAKESYVQRLVAKLSEDNIDLTADEASNMISQIYENVGTGVNEGYIVEVNSGGSNEKNPNTANTNEVEKNDKNNTKRDENTDEKNSTQNPVDENKSKNKVSYTAPKLIKDTGFTYNNTTLTFGVLAMLLFIVMAMSIQVCRTKKEEMENDQIS